MSHPSVLERPTKRLPSLRNIMGELDRLRHELETISAERDRTQHDLEAVSAELAKLQYDRSHFPLLEPKYTARNKLEFFNGIKNSNFSILEKIQSDLISISKGKEFFVKQFCLCCNKTTSMLEPVNTSKQPFDIKALSGMLEPEENFYKQ